MTEYKTIESIAGNPYPGTEKDWDIKYFEGSEEFMLWMYCPPQYYSTNTHKEALIFTNANGKSSWVSIMVEGKEVFGIIPGQKETEIIKYLNKHRRIWEIIYENAKNIFEFIELILKYREVFYYAMDKNFLPYPKLYKEKILDDYLTYGCKDLIIASKEYGFALEKADELIAGYPYYNDVRLRKNDGNPDILTKVNYFLDSPAYRLREIKENQNFEVSAEDIEKCKNLLKVDGNVKVIWEDLKKFLLANGKIFYV